jgi:hypothetical protein
VKGPEMKNIHNHHSSPPNRFGAIKKQTKLKVTINKKLYVPALSRTNCGGSTPATAARVTIPA